MIKTTNDVTIEGYLYEHKLELKTTGPNSKKPGTSYIGGTISIATDEALTNIVPVHYTYVTAVTASGQPNNTYTTLLGIYNGSIKNVMSDGKDNAAKLRISSALNLNEFYSDRNSPNGEPTLISTIRNEGGFITLVNTLSDDESRRATFNCDIVITGVNRIDADPEKGIAERMIVKGGIFDFRKALKPVEFTILNPALMDVFEAYEVSAAKPVFTRVWGNEISTVIVRTTRQEGLLGEDYVREVRSTRRDYVITSGLTETYTWDSEDTMTVEEFKNIISEREVYLATLKQNYLTAKNNKGAAPIPKSNTGFDF